MLRTLLRAVGAGNSSTPDRDPWSLLWETVHSGSSRKTLWPICFLPRLLSSSTLVKISIASHNGLSLDDCFVVKVLLQQEDSKSETEKKTEFYNEQKA